MADSPAWFFTHTHTRGFSAVLVGGSSPGSAPVGCAAVNPFPLSFALQINKLHPLLHLICYQELSPPPPLLPPPPPQVSSPRPTPTPTRQPRPDNDVLITRLLGQKIALILIHMQGNICHRLEAHSPTHTPPPCHAVRVSGRLTLASCCEQS